MIFFTLLIIALGLAMDAFAVSVVSGAAYKKLQVRHIFRIAFFFGAFQAIMPVIGYGAAGRPSGGPIKHHPRCRTPAVFRRVGFHTRPGAPPVANKTPP